MASVSCDVSGQYKAADITRILAEARRQKADGSAYKGMDDRWIDPARSHLNRCYRSPRWEEWGGDPRKAAAQLHHGRKKLTERSILLRGIIIQASPEAFFPDMRGWTDAQKADPAMYPKRGTIDQKTLNLFWERSISALKERYGDMLLEAHLHLDESSPHIHAEIIPYNAEKRAISNNSLFPGAKAVSAFHTFLHERIGRPMGLERSKEGEKRDPTRPAYTPPRDLMEQYQEDRIEANIQAFKREPHWTAKRLDMAQISVMEAENRADRWKATAETLREEVAALRGIEVQAVFEAAGYERRKDTGCWHGPNGEKIGIQAKGQAFIDNHGEARGGGAIDAAMAVLAGRVDNDDLDLFKAALAWLKKRFGLERTTTVLAHHPAARRNIAQTADDLATDGAKAPPPMPRPGGERQMATALAEMRRRGTERAFKACMKRKENSFFVDTQSNLVFPRPTPGFFTLCGTYRKKKDEKNRYKKSTPGKDAPRLVAPQAVPDQRVAIVEGIQDAFALAELFPELTIYIHGGGQGMLPPPGIHVDYFCMDADPVGRREAESLRRLYPGAVDVLPPEPFTDWSDLCQAQAAGQRVPLTGGSMTQWITIQKSHREAEAKARERQQAERKRMERQEQQPTPPKPEDVPGPMPW